MVIESYVEVGRVISRHLHRFFSLSSTVGTQPSGTAVYQGVVGMADNKLSQQYLSKMRSGGEVNPTAEKMAAKAIYFGGDMSSMMTSALDYETEQNIPAKAALRCAGVSAILARTAGVSGKSCHRVVNIVDQMRDLEGLPAISVGD